MHNYINNFIYGVLSKTFDNIKSVEEAYRKPFYTLYEVVFGMEAEYTHNLTVSFKNGIKEDIKITTQGEKIETIEGTYKLIEKLILDAIEAVKEVSKKHPYIVGVKNGVIEVEI